MFKMNINQFMKRKLIGSIVIATMAVSFLLFNPATASADHIGYIYRTKCSTNHKGGHSLYSILYITTDIKIDKRLYCTVWYTDTNFGRNRNNTLKTYHESGNTHLANSGINDFRQWESKQYYVEGASNSIKAVTDSLTPYGAICYQGYSTSTK